ncbi:MAG: hypothetical protein JXR97_15800 [Planctomycetes bacterium]|nr:hypothetical protein [Planctomycetota bacterium]
MKACNEQIEKAIKLSSDMIDLAQNGEIVAEDDRCVVLYGLIRDCGYKIKTLAEKEREAHILKGVWDE